MDAFSDTLGIAVAAVLTILVFSYLLRDTFLFRLAQSLLVGTAIGYGSAFILSNVGWEALLKPLLTNPTDPYTWSSLIVPLLLGLFLWTKLNPGWNTLGNISLGYLFGVGAALAIGGAVNGVLSPQLKASLVSLSPLNDPGGALNNLLIVVGALGALLAFRFTTGLGARPLRIYTAIANVWGRIGRGFIMIAFGATFANVLIARISTLVGQLYFLVHDAVGPIIGIK